MYKALRPPHPSGISIAFIRDPPYRFHSRLLRDTRLTMAPIGPLIVPAPAEAEESSQDPETVPKEIPRRRSVWNILSRSPTFIQAITRSPSPRKVSFSSKITRTRLRNYAHPYLKKSPST